VLPAAVLASIATAYPEKVACAALPLLRCAEFYALDLRRQSQEQLRGGFFGDPFNNDPWSKLYAQERVDASKRLWRNYSLERVLIVFQLDEALRDEALKIVDELKAQALHSQNENLRFTLHRVDSRNFSIVNDEEHQTLYLQNAAELPQDLKVVKESFDRQQKYDSRIQSLYVWARKSWEDGDLDQARYSTCVEALAESRLLVSVRGGSHAQDGTTAQFGNRGWDDCVGRLTVADHFQHLRLRARIGSRALQSQSIGIIILSD